MDRPRRPIVESLETRRLLTADLNFGSSTLTGDVFKPGGSATLNAYVRNFGDLHVTAQFAVQFKYARVDFRADADKVSFDDPAAVVLSTVNVDDDIFIGSVGKQLSFPLTFPGDLAPGRYVLMGKLDSANALLETLESNNIKVFGAGRAFAGDGSLTIPGTPGDDSLSIAATATGHRVTVNGYVEDFTPDKVSSFYVAADGETRRVPWEQVEAADWDRDTDTFRLSEVGSWGDHRPVHTATPAAYHQEQTMTDTTTTTQLDDERPAERCTTSDGTLWLRLWLPSSVPGVQQLQWASEAMVPPDLWARHVAA